MSDVAVEADADERAARLAPAADKMGKSAQRVQIIADAQTTGKWGTEVAPDSFRHKYSRILTDAYDEILSLERELNAYVDTVKTVVANFEHTDTDAATAQQIAAAEAEHRQKEQDHQSDSSHTPGGAPWVATTPV